MRVSDLISLGMRYMKLGLVLVAILGIAAAATGVVYKKKYGGSRKLPGKKTLLYGAFLCYLVVVFGATTLSRGGFYEDIVRLQLFYSYRDAWNDFSITEWRNIILNILMFVPLGFLLPCLHGKFRKAGWTYLAGLVLTAVIEILQLVLKRGIFEMDDLLNNLVGTMIGYGLYRLWEIICEVLRRKRYGKGNDSAREQGNDAKEKKVLVATGLYQLPLVASVIAFAAIFIVYENQELGNLHSEYIVRQKVNSVTTELEFSEEKMALPVYQVPVATLGETVGQAGDFFAKFGDELDEDSADVYENTVVYRSENQKSIWIEYKGSTYNYTDFELQFGEDAPETDLKAEEAEVRKALESLDIMLPEEMDFELFGDSYRFTADLILQDGLLYDGTIECEYTVEDTIAGLRNSLLVCGPYKDFPAISQAEAFRKLAAGEFYYPYEEVWDIEIYDAYLAYEMDSKGFYQPIYRFDAIINAEEGYITIPAVEK